jgi:tetratricopeptide (TPR) repeat protein
MIGTNYYFKYLPLGLSLTLAVSALLTPAAAQTACSGAAQQLLKRAKETLDEEGDPQKAMPLYEQALQTDGRCVEAFIRLAELHLSLERYADAVALLQRAKNVAPENREVLRMLIFALYWSGDYEGTVAEGLRSSTIVGADNLGFLGYYLGLAYARLGNYDEAIRWLEAGAQAQGSGFTGPIAEALIDVYQEALDKSYDPQIALKLGRLLFERSRFAEALRVLTSLVAAHSDLAPAWYWLGATHAKLGHFLDARQALERYLQLSPNGEFADEAKRLLRELLG